MSSAHGNVVSFPHVSRRTPDRLGLYFRASRRDRADLLDFLSTNDAEFHGVVFDPTQTKPQHELREQLLARRIDAVLDPRTQPLATPGGYTDSLGALPWGGDHVHQPGDFHGLRGRQITAAIADFTVDNGFSQVLAPTHLIGDANDPWLPIDLESTSRLRRDLDHRGAHKTPVIYSLAVPYALMRDSERRYALMRELEDLPVDALWLRVDGFGRGSTGAAVRNYLEGVADFHSLDIPIVADGVGGLAGLALAAFGGVGGIAHGITMNESFDASSWRKVREGKPFGIQKRIYVPALDMCLMPREAESLFAQSARTRGLLACRDTDCCPRGPADMLDHPARHFMVQRIAQLQALQDVPESLRANRFLDQFLRASRDRSFAIARQAWARAGSDIGKRIAKQTKRLNMMRLALSGLANRVDGRSRAALPKSLEARELQFSP